MSLEILGFFRGLPEVLQGGAKLQWGCEVHSPCIGQSHLCPVLVRFAPMTDGQVWFHFLGFGDCILDCEPFKDRNT